MVTMQNMIHLTNINEELTRLWNSENGHKKIRASLFSLILYVQKSEYTSFYQGIIKSVVSKFPCRVIMIINETKRAEEYLKTTVSSETIGEEDQKVFCEIIQIEVAGNLIERVPYIVLPHILPDLPVYLLWTQDPAVENAVLPYLEPLANRIIFDSKATIDLQGYCHSVISLIHRFHCAIGDLNWSAISGWRKIFAQVFNDPDAFVSLSHSTLIRIQYNKSKIFFQKHAEIQAAYFQAWLASKLNWKYKSIEINEGNIRLTYLRSIDEIVIVLSPQEGDHQLSGTILSVEIESAKNKGHYIFKRHLETRQVFIQYSEKNFCQLPYSSYLDGVAEGQEIIEEIFYPSGGKHYQDMLETLALTSLK